MIHSSVEFNAYLDGGKDSLPTLPSFMLVNICSEFISVVRSTVVAKSKYVVIAICLVYYYIHLTLPAHNPSSSESLQLKHCANHFALM